MLYLSARLVTLLLWVWANAVLAQTTCVMQPSASSVKFFIKNAGFTTEGSFEKFNATLNFNPTDPASCKLTATAEVASLNTGIGMRDKHLKEADYFDTDKYPQIKFTSERFEQHGTQWQVVGRLQIKATAQTITLPLTMTEQAGKVTLHTQFALDRVAYGVGRNHWTLNNEVRVVVMLVCP